VKVRNNGFFKELVQDGALSWSESDDIAMMIWEIVSRKLKTEWINKDIKKYISGFVYKTVLGYFRKVKRRSLKETIDAYYLEEDGTFKSKAPEKLEDKKKLTDADRITVLLILYRHKIKPQYFMMLCLYYHDGLKFNEVAAIFGVKPSWVAQVKKKIIMQGFPEYFLDSNFADEDFLRDGMQALFRIST
jgi:DNA-directed RNA polymerase specialized sigma24 family protein